VQNAKGKFIKADLDSTTAAAAAVAKTMPSDFRVSITNAPGPDAYPISSFTWLLIPVQSKEPAKGKIIKDFLTWMLGPGQEMTKPLTYAPLPEDVNKRVQAAIAQVK
jgi:phosphate transport system substrate-binding protein